MLIGGLDVGTTGCKFTVYNTAGEFIHKEYREYDVKRVGGEHEIDGEKIFEAVCDVIRCAAEKYPILAMGVSTFGETFAAVDDRGRVLLPSMLYTDPRGESMCARLCERIGEKKLTRITGVKPHHMYSIPKIMWIKENKPEIYQKIKYIFLIEDFIVYRLTGRRQIDYSLAARTMAFDIRKKQWSKEIFDAAGIDPELMSRPVPTGTAAGTILRELSERLCLSEDVLVVSGGHDQVAAALGAGVFEVGSAVDGTGTVECVTPMFDMVPENEKLYDEGYSVVPYVFDNTYVCYAMSYTGGAALKWFRDGFAAAEKQAAEKAGKNVFAELDKKVTSEPGSILTLPHLAGAANPYMDGESKCAVIGLTLEHTAIDLYKSLMEGVAYEMLVNVEHLESFGICLSGLCATGGGAASDVWLQIKANILDRPFTTLDAPEAGACGTCMLVAVVMGAARDLNAARKSFVKYKKIFTPQPEIAEKYKKKYAAYRKIYSAVRPITEVSE